MNIILFGFMGTGKTTVGEKLAEELGWSFLDMDVLIEQREKRTISSIFETDGEARFRQIEKQLVAELARKEKHVISTGGGVVLDPENVLTYQQNGLCVCLCASTETILERVAKQSHRPLLEDGEKERKIRDMLVTRKPLYDAVPHQIQTDTMTPDEIVETILKAL